MQLKRIKKCVLYLMSESAADVINGHNLILVLSELIGTFYAFLAP
jgi:hypothetical protein